VKHPQITRGKAFADNLKAVISPHKMKAIFQNSKHSLRTVGGATDRAVSLRIKVMQLYLHEHRLRFHIYSGGGKIKTRYLSTSKMNPKYFPRRASDSERYTSFVLKPSFLSGRVAVTSAKNHKRQRRKRQSVTAKREKSQTPKVLTAVLTLPNLT